MSEARRGYSPAVSDNVDLIRRGYEAWNRGDVEEVVASLAEDVEWHGHPRLPEPGPYFGRDDVRRWLAESLAPWEEISIHPLAVVGDGNDVIALINITGRGKGSGLEVQSGVDAHVWTVAEGRIVSMRWIQGDEVARQTGLSEEEREVMRLRGAQNLDDEEIGERLHLTAEAVQEAADGALAKLPRLAEGGSE